MNQKIKTKILLKMKMVVKKSPIFKKINSKRTKNQTKMIRFMDRKVQIKNTFMENKLL